MGVLGGVGVGGGGWVCWVGWGGGGGEDGAYPGALQNAQDQPIDLPLSPLVHTRA